MQPSEVKVFNYGYNAGTTVEARVGMPIGRFAGTPVLWFSQVPAAGHTFVPMPFSITVEFYGRIAWPWISVPSTYAASASSPATRTATLSVPTGARPGLYEGQILITLTGGNTTALPVSVIVPKVIDAATLSGSLTTAGSTQIYDPSSVSGYFDWRWRYAAGDWQPWFVDVADPNTVALRVDVGWTDPRTDVDLWSITPGGIPNDSSFSPTLGSDGANSRRFIWSTRTGTTADWVLVSTQSGIDQSVPGLYTFALHNVLLGGTSVPEALTGAVSAVKLNPRGPITIVTQPGKTVSIPFALSTGYALHNDSAFAIPPTLSAFPSTAAPGFTPVIPAGGSLPAWANITIPASTSDGVYVNYLLFQTLGPFGPDALPQVPVRVNVIVDSTVPGVSVRSPAANAYIHGGVGIEAAVAEANGVASVSFSAGAASGTMSRDPVTGLWTATWDTTGTPDGAATISVRATDAAGNVATSARSVVVDNTAPTATIGRQSFDVKSKPPQGIDTTALADGTTSLALTVTDLAGNSASSSLSVTVDNTAPAVTISAPSANANLRDTTTISWTATDANLDTVSIAIDGETRVVTGTTSYTWNTHTVGDGTHTIEVRATDKAGNERAVSVTATTDNVAVATGTAMTAGLTNGLIIGLIAAAIVGFLGGFLTGRRRGPKSPKPQASEPPNPPEDQL